MPDKILFSNRVIDRKRVLCFMYLYVALNFAIPATSASSVAGLRVQRRAFGSESPLEVAYHVSRVGELELRVLGRSVSD